MICIICILVSIFTGLSNSQVNSCRDPDEHFLNKKFTELISSSLFYYQHEMKYKKSVDLYDQKLDENILDDSWQDFKCDSQNGNVTSEEQRSICPRKYSIVFRRNMYPFYRKKVVCTCETCGISDNINLQKSFYKCMPVWREVPVLIREKCQEDGYYYWSPGYEWINHGCTCGTTFKLISYRSTHLKN